MHNIHVHVHVLTQEVPVSTDTIFLYRVSTYMLCLTIDEEGGTGLCGATGVGGCAGVLPLVLADYVSQHEGGGSEGDMRSVGRDCNGPVIPG